MIGNRIRGKAVQVAGLTVDGHPDYPLLRHPTRRSMTATDDPGSANLLTSAEKSITSCEALIQELIKKALRGGAYYEARCLATLGQGLQALSNYARAVQQSRSAADLDPFPDDLIGPINADQLAVTRPKVQKAFKRDGDSLVKLGVAKKSGALYTVKASKEQITAITRYLAEHGGPNTPVRTNRIFGVLSTDGRKPPAYQGHVVLGWLRHVGVVERRGSAGYVVPFPEHLERHVEDLWKALLPHVTL